MRRDRRGRGVAAPSPTRRSSSAASTSWSPTPASPRPRRSRRRRSRCGTATWTSSSTGYFLVAREAFRLMQGAGIGGAIVFIGSKNALAASPGAAAYCTAKAAEIHLARCLALEGAPLGIRVNVGQPGRGAARLEDLGGRVARAARRRLQDRRATSSRSIYRQRSLLKRQRLPRGHRRGVYFFASEPRPSRPATSSTSTPATPGVHALSASPRRPA